MRKYVVTLEACNVGDIVCGLWGVFSSYDKAEHAVFHFMQNYDEILYDWDYSGGTVWLFFTNKSTWRIESLIEDDEGF